MKLGDNNYLFYRSFLAPPDLQSAREPIYRRAKCNILALTNTR